jgi:hypothetical protein
MHTWKIFWQTTKLLLECSMFSLSVQQQYCSVAHTDSSPLRPAVVNSHLHCTKHTCLLQGPSGPPAVDAVYVNCVGMPTLQTQVCLVKLLDVRCLACTLIVE